MKEKQTIMIAIIHQLERQAIKFQILDEEVRHERKTQNAPTVGRFLRPMRAGIVSFCRRLDCRV